MSNQYKMSEIWEIWEIGDQMWGCLLVVTNNTKL